MDRPKLLDRNYVEILLRPRATIREIVDRDPRDRVIALVIVSGLIMAIASAAQFRSLQAFTIGASRIPLIAPATMWKIRLGQVAASPILAVVSLYGEGAILRWCGALLGGTANAVEVRAALGWSSVAATVNGLIVIAFVPFSSALVPETGNLYSVIGLLAHEGPKLVLILLLEIYAWVIGVKCLAEVHQFSAWRAVGALAIQWMLLAGAFLVIAAAFPLVAFFLFR